MQKKKTSESEELYGELGKAFNFTQGDLEANRQGFITNRQGRVQKDYLSWFPLIPITLIGFAACMTFPAIALTVDLFGNFDKPIPAIAWILLMTALALYGIWGTIVTILEAIRWRRDLRDARVESITGRIDLVRVFGGYEIRVQEKKFRITFDQFYYHWKSSPYLMYYLPRTRRIMSIKEFLPELD